MNISSNNMRGFSQYSLLNKLFSQKNGNKAGASKQTDGNTIGGVKHKHSNLYYDENGIPWMSKEQADRCITGRSDWKKIVSVSDEVKAELAEVVKQDFINTNGKSIPEGTRRNDVINKYLNTLPSKQRSSASWTLDRMAGDYGSRLEALVKQINPGWKPGDAFDTSILDQLDGTLGGVDFKA
ncbi:DUF3879 family protein [Lachnospiraceae bacterium 46-15]